MTEDSQNFAEVSESSENSTEDSRSSIFNDYLKKLREKKNFDPSVHRGFLCSLCPPETSTFIRGKRFECFECRNPVPRQYRRTRRFGRIPTEKGPSHCFTVCESCLSKMEMFRKVFVDFRSLEIDKRRNYLAECENGKISDPFFYFKKKIVLRGNFNPIFEHFERVHRFTLAYTTSLDIVHQKNSEKVVKIKCCKCQGEYSGVNYKCVECYEYFRKHYYVCIRCYVNLRRFHNNNHTFICTYNEKYLEMEEGKSEEIVEKEIKNFNFPFDCLSLIIRFFNVEERRNLIFKFLSLSSYLRKFVLDNHNSFLRDVEFNLRDCNVLGEEEKMKYVLNLNIKGMYVIGFNDQNRNRVLSHFPNVEKLSIFYSNGMNDNCLSFGKNLKFLKLSDCGDFKDDGFKFVPNLETLVIDESCQQCSRYLYSDSLLEHIPNLRVLKLYATHLSNEGFRYLKKLEKLTLHFCQNLTDEIFDYLTELKNLKIVFCFNFSMEGLEKLRKSERSMEKMKKLKLINIGFRKRALQDIFLSKLEIEEKIAKRDFWIFRSMGKKDRTVSSLMRLSGAKSKVQRAFERFRKYGGIPLYNLRRIYSDAVHPNQEYITMLTNGKKFVINPQNIYEVI